MIKHFSSATIAIVLFILCAMALRAAVAIWMPFPFEGDEAAEALLAMDVWQHPRFIVGWPGQDYMGSLQIYALSVFGAPMDWSIASLRFTKYLFVILQVAVVALIARRSRGIAAALISLAALCGLSVWAYCYELRYYPLMLLIMLTAVAFKSWLTSRPQQPHRAWYVLLGALAGIAVWTNEIAMLLLFPLIIPAENERRHEGSLGLLFISGLMIGFSPRIAYNVLACLDGFKFLAGSLLGVSREDFVLYGWHAIFHRQSDHTSIVEHVMHRLENIDWMIMALLLVAGTFAAVQIVRRRQVALRPHWLPVGLAISIVLVLVIGSKPRYAGLAIPYAALLAGLVLSHMGWIARRPRTLAMTLLAAGICVSVVSALSRARDTDYHVDDLASFVKRHGYTTGISGYGLAHMLMFYSRGTAISSLGGPFFTTRLLDVERTVALRGAEFVVYDVAEDTILRAALADYLTRNAISYVKETIAGHFEVYHRFSQPVFPGAWMPPDWEKRYERHTPSNPRKIRQEGANELRLRGIDFRKMRECF